MASFLLFLCLSIASLASATGMNDSGARFERKLNMVRLPLVLSYHHGPLMVGPLQFHVLFYGSFTSQQQAIVTDFLQSLAASDSSTSPSVSTWWKIACSYQSNSASTSNAQLGVASSMPYTLGRNLTKQALYNLLADAISNGVFPKSDNAIYIILTASDVYVEQFCVSTCGFHSYITVNGADEFSLLLPFIWVGNSGIFNPGYCSWPYAVPQYGPPSKPLGAPNGDVGMEGVIINLATLLAGTVTNPFNTGYFMGDEALPLESATACPGIFASGHYPGYAGNLLTDRTNGACYNTVGMKKRKFLLPAVWDPSTSTCTTLI